MFSSVTWEPIPAATDPRLTADEIDAICENAKRCQQSVRISHYAATDCSGRAIPHKSHQREIFADHSTGYKPVFLAPVHPSLKTWAHSQAHHDSDPNQEFWDANYCYMTVHNSLYSSFIRGQMQDQEERLLEFARRSRVYAKFRDSAPCQQQKEERFAAVSAVVHDYDLFPNRDDATVDWEKRLRQVFIAEWEVEKQAGEKVSEAYKQEMQESGNQELVLYNMKMFVPNKPLCSSELPGIKFYPPGVRVPRPTKTSSQEGREVDAESLGKNNLPEGTIEDFGRRETQNPVDRTALVEMMRIRYNPNGNLSREEVKRRINPLDALDFVARTENIPVESLAVYLGISSESFRQRRSRSRQKDSIDRLGHKISASQVLEAVDSGGWYGYYRLEGQAARLLFLDNVKNREEATVLFKLSVENLKKIAIQRAKNQNTEEIAARWDAILQTDPTLFCFNSQD